MKRDQRRDSRPPFRHFWWLLGPVVAAVVYVWSTWPSPQPRVGGSESPSQTVPEGAGQPPKVSVPRQVPPDRPPPAASLPARHQPAVPMEESDPTANMTASWQRIDDPSTDGWDTEDLSELASEVCGQIGAALVADDPLTTEQAAVWVAADFTCTALLPALETVYQDKEFQVERLQSPDLPDGTTHVGAAGLRDALNRWREQSLWDSAPTFSKKVVRVEQRERQCVTQHLLRLVGNSRRGRQQQDTVWSMRWSLEPSGNLRMESIDVESFEQARSLRSGTTFVDCTHDALANNSDDRATQTTQTSHPPHYTFITQLSCLRSVSCLRPTSVAAIPVRRSPSACLMMECPDDRATQTSQTTHSTYNTCTPQISRLRSVSGSARGGALQSTQTPHLT